MIVDLTRQLRRDEGEVLHAYRDSEGYLTIGVGRLIDPVKRGGISREESDYLLANDIGRVLHEVADALPWTQSLDDARRGVLCNMAFQLGIGGLLRFTRTLGYVESGQWDAAATEMLDSRWAREQAPERALRLSAQMRTGEWQ